MFQLINNKRYTFLTVFR